MIKTILNIDGMSCKHCASKVKNALEQNPEIHSVKVNLNKKEATILSNKVLDTNKITKTIEDLGYSVKGVN